MPHGEHLSVELHGFSFIKRAEQTPPRPSVVELHGFQVQTYWVLYKAFKAWCSGLGWLSAARMAALLTARSIMLTVDAEWDAEAGVWVATSDNVPGLVTEADSIEALAAKLQVLVPELLEANASSALPC